MFVINMIIAIIRESQLYYTSASLLWADLCYRHLLIIIEYLLSIKHYGKHSICFTLVNSHNGLIKVVLLFLTEIIKTLFRQVKEQSHIELDFKYTALLSFSFFFLSHNVQLPEKTMLCLPCPFLLFSTQNCQGHKKQGKLENCISLEESKETQYM